MKIIIPESGPKPLYYNTHVMYFRGLLDSLNIPYTLKGDIEKGTTKFPVMIDDKRILIDFSDHPDCLDSWDSFDAYFKYHYSYRHIQNKIMYPFAPISFYNWKQYRDLSREIRYTCASNTVLNMQKPYAGALERRNFVQKVLKSKYPNVVIRPIGQTDYWKKINDCLVHVFVPGARNDMIDRGHMQYLAFGCCTIAPPITDVLPYDEQIKSDVHYIECAEDYSDLIEKIEWCKQHREFCRCVGSAAKELFERTCTPQRLWDWILEKTQSPETPVLNKFKVTKPAGNRRIRLSILICSLRKRQKQLASLLQDLNKQRTDEVEILTNIDNRQKTTGAKRNELLLQAKGDYIAFVDDDDKVAENYILKILKAISLNPDCVGMEGLITFASRGITRKFIHSIRYKNWFERNHVYYRNPNHLNPVRRELALKVMFPEITVEEDKAYSKKLLPYLKTEVYLSNPIYFYLTQ